MTPEEAKEYIKRQMVICARRNGKTLETDFVRTIVDALDKQIPKPLAHRINCYYLQIPLFDHFCPTCNNKMSKYLVIPNYCPECGQALKSI